MALLLPFFAPGTLPNGPPKLTERINQHITPLGKTDPGLRPLDQAAAVARLGGLGACRADVGQGPEVTWVVLADLDGSEFCLLRALKPQDRAYEGV